MSLEAYVTRARIWDAGHAAKIVESILHQPFHLSLKVDSTIGPNDVALAKVKEV